MKRTTKLGLYLVLGLVAVLFGQRFYQEYGRFMRDDTAAGTTNLEDVRLPRTAVPTPENAKKEPVSRLAYYAAAFFATVVILGLLVAHDVSQHFGHRTLKTLYGDDGDALKASLYEQGEQEWANGNHLEAINLMREYLKENKREQHVALRIAEIYEKDLQNFLAAALEYEEVLKQKLSPQRWGWAAIHLCNLYGRLNQPDKAVALLRRIERDYSDTPAAEKARKRLALLEGRPVETEGEDVNTDDSAPS